MHEAVLVPLYRDSNRPRPNCLSLGIALGLAIAVRLCLGLAQDLYQGLGFFKKRLHRFYSICEKRIDLCKNSKVSIVYTSQSQKTAFKDRNKLNSINDILFL